MIKLELSKRDLHNHLFGNASEVETADISAPENYHAALVSILHQIIKKNQEDNHESD